MRASYIGTVAARCRSAPERVMWLPLRFPSDSPQIHRSANTASLSEATFKEIQMGPFDQAGDAREALDDFYANAALAEAADYAQINEDLDAADEELFEDDLISLIASRPSRQQRRHATG